MHDVLIIGSGLGGLECGALLARRGLKVLVLEGSNQPGGCMQSFRRGGQHYDTGLHYVGGLAPGQALHNAFSQIGLLDLPWERMDEDFDHVIIDGQHFTFRQGYKAFAEGLAKDFPHQREAIQSYVQRLQNITVADMEVCAYDAYCPADVIEAAGVKAAKSQDELFETCDIVSLHIPATPETKQSINKALVGKMKKEGIVVNTARKEVINEDELIELMQERTDIKYVTDIMPDADAVFQQFEGRYFSTPKKMGAQTAEANINAGIAAAKQIVGFLRDGVTKFQVNK